MTDVPPLPPPPLFVDVVVGVEDLELFGEGRFEFLGERRPAFPLPFPFALEFPPPPDLLFDATLLDDFSESSAAAAESP
jgi:hypothetical protein